MKKILTSLVATMALTVQAQTIPPEWQENIKRAQAVPGVQAVLSADSTTVSLVNTKNMHHEKTVKAGHVVVADVLHMPFRGEYPTVRLLASVTHTACQRGYGIVRIVPIEVGRKRVTEAQAAELAFNEPWSTAKPKSMPIEPVICEAAFTQGIFNR